MDPIQTIDDEVAKLSEKAENLKGEVQAIELQILDLHVARRVLVQLGMSSVDHPLPNSIIRRRRALPIAPEGGKKSIRRLILEAMPPGLPMSKTDIHGQIRAREDIDVNLQTLGSTLSRMVGQGMMQKAGVDGYRRPRHQTLSLDDMEKEVGDEVDKDESL